MSNLVRRNWNNRGGADPALWEKPVNQASKWLAARSGSSRILQAGGTATVTNNDSRKFLLSVFVGDGGTVDLGGTSGNNTVQISRTGSTITVTCRSNGGKAGTQTFTTSTGADRWASIYLKCTASGVLSDQVTVTAMCDFSETKTLIATSAFFGDTFTTNNKVLALNSLSGLSLIHI